MKDKIMQIQTDSPFSTQNGTAFTQPVKTAEVNKDTPKKDINTDPLAQKEVFLQLLVAQIKNQNPLNPSDSVQFLTQLSQFSSVEQLVGIRQDIGTLVKNQNNSAAATPPAASEPKP